MVGENIMNLANFKIAMHMLSTKDGNPSLFTHESLFHRKWTPGGNTDCFGANGKIEYDQLPSYDWVKNTMNLCKYNGREEGQTCMSLPLRSRKELV